MPVCLASAHSERVVIENVLPKNRSRSIEGVFIGCANRIITETMVV